MRRITNREEANSYYKKINEIIDEYINNWKIKPTEVYHYFNRNMNSFIDEIGMSDVIGIQKVVEDIISHKKNIELDSVMTYENFNLSSISTELEKEKVIGDFFNVGLGHIEILDRENNIFRVKDFGKNIFVGCLSQEDVNKLKELLVNEIVESTKTKPVSLSIEGSSVKFWLSEIIDAEELRIRSLKQVDELIWQILKSKMLSSTMISTKYQNCSLEKFQGHYIFSLD
jgi:hypothetical protein